MDGHRFDELTRTLATGVSRRGIVKALAGGVTGAVLAAIGRDAAAAPNRCAQGCAFEPKGPRQAACKQACKKCDGDFSRVCFGTEIICCPPDTTCCSSPAGETCCPVGTICDFNTGECLTECPPESGCLGPDCAPGCFCVTSVDGATACVDAAFADCFAPTCVSDADCGGGVCVNATACCGFEVSICFPAEAICEIGGGSGTAPASSPWT